MCFLISVFFLDSDFLAYGKHLWWVIKLTKKIHGSVLRHSLIPIYCSVEVSIGSVALCNFCQLWHPNTRKLCRLDKNCIELDLCILIRRTILFFMIISLCSIITKIYGKNMHFWYVIFHFLEGHIGQSITVVDYSYTWSYRPNQDLSNDILLNSIDHHGLAPQPVEITLQPKVDQLWRPKTPLKNGFSLM